MGRDSYYGNIISIDSYYGNIISIDSYYGNIISIDSYYGNKTIFLMQTYNSNTTVGTFCEDYIFFPCFSRAADH